MVGGWRVGGQREGEGRLGGMDVGREGGWWGGPVMARVRVGVRVTVGVAEIISI